MVVDLAMQKEPAECQQEDEKRALEQGY